MRKKVELSVFAVMGIVIISLLGVTLAYFVAVANNTGDNIEGRTFDFGASINLTTIYRANNLVPLSDNLVGTAISKETNKCIDKNGRDVCSLYSITLSNTGDTVSLTPSITTTNSTYTTNDIRCQLYDSSFTAVSDVITPSNTNNGKVYMTSNSNNLSINLSSTSKDYYLVIWLEETNNSQTDDYSKIYNGTITFEGENGEEAYVDFTA